MSNNNLQWTSQLRGLRVFHHITLLPTLLGGQGCLKVPWVWWGVIKDVCHMEHQGSKSTTWISGGRNMESIRLYLFITMVLISVNASKESPRNLWNRPIPSCEADGRLYYYLWKRIRGFFEWVLALITSNIWIVHHHVPCSLYIFLSLRPFLQCVKFDMNKVDQLFLLIYVEVIITNINELRYQLFDDPVEIRMQNSEVEHLKKLLEPKKNHISYPNNCSTTFEVNKPYTSIETWTHNHLIDSNSFTTSR